LETADEEHQSTQSGQSETQKRFHASARVYQYFLVIQFRDMETEILTTLNPVFRLCQAQHNPALAYCQHGLGIPIEANADPKPFSKSTQQVAVG